MEKINLTCIECPIGCSITVEKEGDEILSISGNACPRGAVYSKNEVTNPKRVITTTTKTISGRLVAVKTDAPVSKANMFNVVNAINKTTVSDNVKIGDVVIEKIEGNVNVIITSNPF